MSQHLEQIRPVDLEKTDPNNFSCQHVGCIVLTRDDRILLQQRPHYWRTFPGCIATFGGHIEPEDKAPLDALIRELKEELGAEVQPMDVIFIEVVTEAITEYSELLYLYCWQDRKGTITGCYEGEPKYCSNCEEAFSLPNLMEDVRWLLQQCLKRNLLR